MHSNGKPNVCVIQDMDSIERIVFTMTALRIHPSEHQWWKHEQHGKFQSKQVDIFEQE